MHEKIWNQADRGDKAPGRQNRQEPRQRQGYERHKLGWCASSRLQGCRIRWPPHGGRHRMRVLPQQQRRQGTLQACRSRHDPDRKDMAPYRRKVGQDADRPVPAARRSTWSRTAAAARP